MNTLSVILLILLAITVSVVVLLVLRIQRQTPALIALQKDLEHAKEEAQTAKTNAQERINEVKAQNEQTLKAQYEQQKIQYEQQKEQYQQLLDQQDATHKQALENQKELFNQSIKEMKESIRSTSEATLKQRQEEFAQSSKDKLSQLLDPLKHDLENMQKSVVDNKEKQLALHSSMEAHIEALLKQSNITAQSATALADALKNKGKVHGDWGESVLEDILVESGLREGAEYEKQVSITDANDTNRRPDIIVHFAEGKNLVIDSKVSLTAYTEALEAPTDEEREAAVKKHCRSIKEHIKELTDKRYQTLVPNAMEYVLMFIPNEGAYVMAMNENPRLLHEAYRQGVIIVNPTNLMLTLHLVLIAWQQTRQEDNCKNILKAANNLYEKTLTVVDSFTSLGNQLNTASRTYHTAINQLSEGQGNLLRQTEQLKEMGITSTKKRTKTLNQPAAETLLPLTEEA